MPIKNLKDGVPYEKAVHHNGKPLKGKYEVTYKIDGVRALRNKDGEVVSRNSKPLYNLDHLNFKDAEIFRDNWETSVSLVRSQSYKEITQDDVYELGYYDYDHRLDTGVWLTDPTYDTCLHHMQLALDNGYEGIVMRGEDARGSAKWIKVVPEITADVRVTGCTMSDKRVGFIKNFITAHGSIGGTSFSIDQLEEIQRQGTAAYIGKIMEVAFRETTSNGKMRFGKFTRWRFDKDVESFN